MDVASSLAGLIALADLVVTKGLKYASAVREAPKELHLLATETATLRTFLSILKDKIVNSSLNEALSNLQAFPLNTALQALTGAGPVSGNNHATVLPQGQTTHAKTYLDETKETLEAIGGLVSKWSSKPGEGATNTLKRAAWPFKIDDANALLERLRRQKDNFELAISIDNSGTLQELLGISSSLQKDLPRIRDGVFAIRSEIPELKNNLTFVRNRIPQLRDGVSLIRQDALDIKEEQLRLKVERERQNLEKKRHEILVWLSPLDKDAIHESLGKLHQPGTGEWLLKAEPFQKWFRGEHQTVWLHGIPGSGKTLLSFAAIEYLKSVQLQNKVNQAIGFAYHYCDFKNKESQDSALILGSLLKQLCENLPTDDLYRELEVLYDAKSNSSSSRNTSATVEDLAGLLLKASEAYSSCMLLLDALDECPRDIREATLIPALLSLASQGHKPIQIFISSRRELDIRNALKGFPQLAVEDGDISGDLKMHINREIQRLPKLRRLKKDVRDHLQTELLGRADGMFRWVDCQLQILSKLRTEQAVLDALDRGLPQGLHETYDRIVDAIDSDDKEIARRVFCWLAFSSYPLSVGELLDAIMVDLEDDDRHESKLLPEEDVLEICGSLISVTSAGRRSYLGLAHYTVKEYLIVSEATTPSSIFQTCPSRAHGELAKICLRYLTFQSFEAYTLKEHEKEPDYRLRLGQHIEKYPLTRYAALNWLHHYHEFHGPCCEELIEALIGLSSPSNLFRSWQGVLSTLPFTWARLDKFGLRAPTTAYLNPSLLSAAYYGLPSLCRTILRETGDQPREHVGRKLALLYATSKGHMNVVDVLLDHGIDPNEDAFASIVESFVRALPQGFRGNEATNTFAVVKAIGYVPSGGFGTNALEAAISTRNENIAIRLLDRGAIPTNFALRLAIQGNFSSLLPILINKLPTQPETYAGEGHLANSLKFCVDPKIFRLLLSRGVDPDQDSKKETGTSLLEQACKYGNEEIVELLLESGANPDLPDGAPLRVACERGHEGVVRRLLAAGASLVMETTMINWDFINIQDGLRACSNAIKSQSLSVHLDYAQENPLELLNAEPPNYTGDQDEADEIHIRDLCTRCYSDFPDRECDDMGNLTLPVLDEFSDEVRCVLTSRTVRTLLDADTDPKGATALSWAHTQGRVDIAEALLSAGAGPLEPKKIEAFKQAGIEERNHFRELWSDAMFALIESPTAQTEFYKFAVQRAAMLDSISYNFSKALSANSFAPSSGSPCK